MQLRMKVPAALQADATAVSMPAGHDVTPSVTVMEMTAEPAPVARKRPRSKKRWLLYGALLAMGLFVAEATYKEMQSSALQATGFSYLADQMTYRLIKGASPAHRIQFPEYGPFDVRLGYASLPDFKRSLAQQHYVITEQARWSNSLLRARRFGIFPPYQEKAQTGLHLHDEQGQTIYQARYPRFVFQQYDQIAPAIIEMLLFIENRELLDQKYPRKNPAVEWDRMFSVTADLLMNQLRTEKESLAGASTLATQIEKYRHSPKGLTHSPLDKLQQMGSASLRAYRDGEETLSARKQIILDYLNTVPLAARAGFGEINGIGDGLRVWFQRDPQQVNQLLQGFHQQPQPVSDAVVLAFKQVLSLFLAQRRPSGYLAHPDKLDQLTNRYLRLLASAGYVTWKFADRGRKMPLQYGVPMDQREQAPYVAKKAVNYSRNRLLSLLDVDQFYQLDQMDLSVNTTYNHQLQQQVRQLLYQVQNPEQAQQAGLYGPYLLDKDDDLSKIIFSFTLFERTPHANLVRVQTDNFDQPFDVNEGVKLDLGSTAKLRTLISYLNVMSTIYQRYAAYDIEQLKQVDVDPGNHLLRWGIHYLIRYPDQALAQMLQAAMNRGYSANPDEQFYTGGGLHQFSNFNHKYDHQVVTVHQALRHSINLPFIRIMRDVVQFHMQEITGATIKTLNKLDEKSRADYLSRFADREGGVFLRRFYEKYQSLSPTEIEQRLLESFRLTPVRLAVAYQQLRPKADTVEFSDWLQRHLPGHELKPHNVSNLFQHYVQRELSLMDQGYIIGIHPLELWTASWLMQHPESDLKQLLANSVQQRQDVYEWLRQTRHRHAQDIRIRQLMEVEAFLAIHQEWQQLGYPFDGLVPSYATAIGSSADRPAALAELMGVILNDGVKLPTVRIEKLHFAANTPYETVFERQPQRGRQVMNKMVAATLKKALRDVVEYGTARRINTPVLTKEGQPLLIGGKTGTGDHRYEVFGGNGELIRSIVRNRTATFVFYVGDKYFGTITAFVPGNQAKDYRFTSGLPVTLLKQIMQQIGPFLDAAPARQQVGQSVFPRLRDYNNQVFFENM